MVIMASAGGNTVPAIARLVQGDEDVIRQVIHRFNQIGLACLDPRWAGGRPRRISDDDEAFIIATARTRPQVQDQPFTRWSLRKLCGVRQFHACYSVGDDNLFGVVRERKSAGSSLAALRSIRAARPDGAPIYIILDNLSAHKGLTIRAWAAHNQVEPCFTPTYSSWANPIEAHFGPLRMFVVAGSNHPNHVVATRALHGYLRWRNANARHPDVLSAQRREPARVRSERQHRWGQTTARAAA